MARFLTEKKLLFQHIPRTGGAWIEKALDVSGIKVNRWLKGLGVSEVRLFSFAVWDAKDQARFAREFKPWLERDLGVKFLDCPTVDDFSKADTQVTRLRWDTRFDFTQTRGKLDGFRSWCKLNFDKQHNVLLDDVVPNATWHDTDSGLKLEFVNVRSLK